MKRMHLLRDGVIHKPVLAGRSVHNTRIERLWREVRRVVGDKYKEIFLEMEANGLLRRELCLDIWCLHCIFLPMIREDLLKLQNIWNYHQCESSSNKSPHEIQIEGQICHPLETHLPINEFVDDVFAIEDTVEPIELGEMKHDEENESEELEEPEELEDAEIFRPPIPEEALQWLRDTYIPMEPLEDVQAAIQAYAALRAALLVLLEEQNLDSISGY